MQTQLNVNNTGVNLLWQKKNFTPHSVKIPAKVELLQKGEARPANSINPFLSITRVNSQTIPTMNTASEQSHDEWWSSLRPIVRDALDSSGGGNSFANFTVKERNVLVETVEKWLTTGRDEAERINEELNKVAERMGLTLANWITSPSQNLTVAFFQCPDGGDSKIYKLYADGSESITNVPADFNINGLLFADGNSTTSHGFSDRSASDFSEILSAWLKLLFSELINDTIFAIHDAQRPTMHDIQETVDIQHNEETSKSILEDFIVEFFGDNGLLLTDRSLLDDLINSVHYQSFIET